MDQAKPKGAGKSSFELIDTQILEQMLPIHKGSAILDLACGKGLYSLFLSQLSGPSGLVYAVDLWEEGLEILEQDALKKEFRVLSASVRDLSFFQCYNPTILA
jgi:ubiquinone/menaquinone biosynthesis C-methylase UbiE